MDDQMRKQLQEFFTICFARLDQQEEPRGERFRNIDLFEEISQELADVANYAFLQYVKIAELKTKTKQLKRDPD